MTSSSGILLVDKPEGITSHGVVARARRVVGTKKVGHAGTLDPMATGLLVLGVNSSTRLLTYLVGLDKEYRATIRLGAATSTDDREGAVIETAAAGAVDALTDEAIDDGIRRLTGRFDQVPSSVSAIKVDGKRAYALVREGNEVELAPRSVTITAFERLAARSADGSLDLDVRVECSSGTYIRALARDLGRFLGVGGHLTALRRTRIGPFDVTDAVMLDELDRDRDLRTPASVASMLFPTVDLDQQQVVDLAHGKRITVSSQQDGTPVAALAPDGRLVGLLETVNGQARPIVNFPADEVLA